MDRQRLVLIGGSAGVGKTTIARSLSRSLEAGWLQVDSLWLALTDAAGPGTEQRQILDIDDQLRNGTEPAEALVSQHVEAASMVCAALLRPLRFELQTHGTVVADGAWILPEWAAQLDLERVDVNAVFVHEPDFERLRQAMESRRSTPMVAPWHERSARLAWLYGTLLAERARRQRLPVVETRPYDSLVDRVRAVIG